LAKRKRKGGRKVAKRRRRVSGAKRTVRRYARKAGLNKVLMGVGAAALTGALINRLGVNLGGFEGFIPHAAAYMTGGIEGALTSVVLTGLPIGSAATRTNREAV